MKVNGHIVGTQKALGVLLNHLYWQRQLNITIYTFTFTFRVRLNAVPTLATLVRYI